MIVGREIEDRKTQESGLTKQDKTINEETLICIRISSVAQSRWVKPLSCVKLLFSSLSCKISNLSISLWGKHSCTCCIILYKHLTILFELCCSTHYSSFEERMLEHWHVLILQLLNVTQQQIASKPLCFCLIIHRPCAVASRINSEAEKKKER